MSYRLIEYRLTVMMNKKPDNTQRNKMNKDKIIELNETLKHHLKYTDYGLCELSQKLDSYIIDDFAGKPVEYLTTSPSDISSVIKDVCTDLKYKFKEKESFGINGTIEVWVYDEIGDLIHFIITKKENSN